MANNRGKSSSEKGRTISDALAPVIEHLELKGDRAVILDDIREQLKGSSESTVRWIVHELVQRGWLEPLAVKGAYEFIPGAAAGRFRSGDPWLDLEAALRVYPKLQVQIGFSSAAWIRGFLKRVPSEHILIVAGVPKPPPSLSDVYRVVKTSHNNIFGWVEEKGIPVSDVERIFVEVAWRPDVTDMKSSIGWLRNLVRELNSESLIGYLKRLGIKSAWARIGYLAELIGTSSLASHIEGQMPKSKGPFYWGDAEMTGQYIARWKLYDNVGLGKFISERSDDI